MKNMFFLLFFSVFLGACSSSKKLVTKQIKSTPKTIKSSIKKSSLRNKPKKSTKKTITKADKVVANALKYTGVKYKYGGTTRRGMDCSGMVYVAFGEENFQLPRVSRDMAKRGKTVPLSKVKKGDLLFFKTSKTRNRINHVGLVISNKNGQIRFVHSTSSRGVIVSLMSEKYWKNAFEKATSLL